MASKQVLAALLILCTVLSWLTVESSAYTEGLSTKTVTGSLGLQGGRGGGNVSEPPLFNVTLLISGSEGEEPNLQGLNVTVYDLNGTVVAYGLPNSTGHVKLRLPEGVYTASVNYGYRVVGRREINVTGSGFFTVNTWVYNLTVECIDLKGRLLADHVVYLYDQMIFYSLNNFTVVTNQTGRLVGWNKTQADGRTVFRGLWNGTYLVRVVGGKVIGEELIDVQKSEEFVITCNKTDMVLRFVTTSNNLLAGDPIPNVMVHVYDSEGNTVFKEYTNESGYVVRKGMYAGEYSIFAEWEGVEIWSGIIDVSGDEVIIECPVYRLTIRALDPSGNPIPNADVTIIRMIRRYRRYIREVISTYKTDEFGYVSLLLPHGRYEVHCAYGIYTGLVVLDLNYNSNVEVPCSINAGMWFSTFFVPLPLLVLIFILERRKLKKPLEMRRYRTMLNKLENLYENGLVEYRLYRKLREEYESKLMELGGREMR